MEKAILKVKGVSYGFQVESDIERASYYLMQSGIKAEFLFYEGTKHNTRFVNSAILDATSVIKNVAKVFS